MKSTVNGIAINYELSGAADGPAVVLHHPLATNLSCWDELTAALEEKYRVLRLDARGHGQSDAPAGAYTFETLAKDVVDLMTACGIEKASFLGLSMGGMVGQYLGLLHPERFKCLLLVSTSSRISPESLSLLRDVVGVSHNRHWARACGAEANAAAAAAARPRRLVRRAIALRSIGQGLRQG